VSSGVLALDLARHPAGARVADLVERVLLLDAGELARLAEAGGRSADRGAARRRLLEVTAQAPTMADALSAVTHALRDAPDSAQVAQASAALASRLTGRLPDLQALLLGADPLADPATPVEAIAAVLDAVTATWLAASVRVRAEDVQTLRAPWHVAVDPFPVAVAPAVPERAAADLLDLLDRVARSTPEQWAGLDTAHEASYDALGWSSTMHEACRAAADADRTVDIARWQLAAARTAANTGHPRAVCAPGAMMSVVAAVQATCVRDLLPQEPLATMTGPCRAVLGWPA
jgi:hypothetical protein